MRVAVAEYLLELLDWSQSAEHACGNSGKGHRAPLETLRERQQIDEILQRSREPAVILRHDDMQAAGRKHGVGERFETVGFLRIRLGRKDLKRELRQIEDLRLDPGSPVDTEQLVRDVQAVCARPIRSCNNCNYGSNLSTILSKCKLLISKFSSTSIQRMKPRSLRHRLEKAAKLLVTIQKHTPEVSCIFDEGRGAHGHIVADFADAGVSRSKMLALGKDLEGLGYHFIEKRSPWLGQITYTGRVDEKPTVVLSLPISKDRLAINEQAPEKPFSFAEA